MAIKNLVMELRDLCERLTHIDFEYPLGQNIVLPPTSADLLYATVDRIKNRNARDQLIALYSECDGFSLPDVHVGYFVKMRSLLDSYDRSSEPDTVLLQSPISVMSFGSTGGGDLFVLDCDDGNVMLLPPGTLLSGQYDGRGKHVRDLAPDIEAFIERLTSDVRAFVSSGVHEYFV
jgi:hypothetical protein